MGAQRPSFAAAVGAAEAAVAGDTCAAGAADAAAVTDVVAEGAAGAAVDTSDSPAIDATAEIVALRAFTASVAWEEASVAAAGAR